MKIVGVDGCKAGWISISIEDENWEVKLFSNIEDVWCHYRTASVILIDVPIGLKETGNKERLCDLEARKILRGHRASSVFPVPCRSAMYADNYEEANIIKKNNVARGLSKQSWGIVPKIREVDSFISSNMEANEIIKESHPELCFLCLAGKPMEYSKKDKEGFEERLAVLKTQYSRVEEIVDYTLKHF